MRLSSSAVCSQLTGAAESRPEAPSSWTRAAFASASHSRPESTSVRIPSVRAGNCIAGSTRRQRSRSGLEGRGVVGADGRGVVAIGVVAVGVAGAGRVRESPGGARESPVPAPTPQPADLSIPGLFSPPHPDSPTPTLHPDSLNRLPSPIPSPPPPSPPLSPLPSPPPLSPPTSGAGMPAVSVPVVPVVEAVAGGSDCGGSGGVFCFFGGGGFLGVFCCLGCLAAAGFFRSVCFDFCGFPVAGDAGNADTGNAASKAIPIDGEIEGCCCACCRGGGGCCCCACCGCCCCCCDSGCAYPIARATGADVGIASSKSSSSCKPAMCFRGRL